MKVNLNIPVLVVVFVSLFACEKDAKYECEDSQEGNLETGDELSFDELRKIQRQAML